ncbi:MAG: protein kinase, partial [Anaerolineales bacterium]|nr:protein kinase [Anaerolineales bacterium]
MVQLIFNFLGTFQVVIDGQPITRFRSANVQALLLYVALPPNRPLNRDLLATLLWPEASQKAAATNFRQTLYQLRKLLPEDVLNITRQTVEFVGGDNFSCDAHQFERTIERGELATAASLFKGDLAAGLTTDSVDFEEWLRQEREHLHQKALGVLERLTIEQLASGDFMAAIATARQQLSLEPWLESAHRQLMRALALSGDRNGALAQFEQCKQILDEELSVEPESETLALIERIENEALTEVDLNLIAGKYALDEQIGRGAMGLVYRGRNVQTGQVVAIKMLDPRMVEDQPELIERFKREGEALQQLNHPNIVKLLVAAEKDSNHYLVMDYVSGGDLDQLLLKQGALSQTQALTIALDLADALTRAHRLEILHRDLKPANVLIDQNGLPRLS